MHSFMPNVKMPTIKNKDMKIVPREYKRLKKKWYKILLNVVKNAKISSRCHITEKVCATIKVIKHISIKAAKLSLSNLCSFRKLLPTSL